MPIVNSNQARIELSNEQAERVAELLHGSEAPMIYIEETNLGGGTVVVGGKGMPLTLVDHNGYAHRLGQRDDD
jgi:hypothetical protein